MVIKKNQIIEAVVLIIGIILIIYSGKIAIDTMNYQINHDTPILVDYCKNKTGIQYINNLPLKYTKGKFFNCDKCNNKTCYWDTI